MQRYVVGFLFSSDRTQIALVLKNRPAWQAGKFNGPGGKIEGDETPLQAMRREYREESGVDLPENKWQEKLRLSVQNVGVVHFFAAASDAIANVSTQENEEIHILNVKDVLSGVLPIIENLKWIIPLSLDPHLCGVAAAEEKAAEKAIAA